MGRGAGEGRLPGKDWRLLARPRTSVMAQEIVATRVRGNLAATMPLCGVIAG